MAQCGNIFYVKSIFENLEVLKMLFLPSFMVLNFGNLVNWYYVLEA